MKEIKPTNETGKNPETEQEKEVLPGQTGFKICSFLKWALY